MPKLSLLGPFLSLCIASAGSSACMMDSKSSPDANSAAEADFLSRAKGRWLYEFRIDGNGASVWVSDFLQIDRDRHDVSADIYADEARTTRLFHLEYTATLAIEQSAALPDTFAADIHVTTETITAFVDDPALWAAFGVDDCKLVVNQAVDVVPTNCLFPLTRSTKCTELELYEIREGSNELRAGVPEADPCAKRPTAVDRTRAPYVRQ